jgi:hypothetical protein
MHRHSEREREVETDCIQNERKRQIDKQRDTSRYTLTDK